MGLKVQARCVKTWTQACDLVRGVEMLHGELEIISPKHASRTMVAIGDYWRFPEMKLLRLSNAPLSIPRLIDDKRFFEIDPRWEYLRFEAEMRIRFEEVISNPPNRIIHDLLRQKQVKGMRFVREIQGARNLFEVYTGNGVFDLSITSRGEFDFMGDPNYE